MITESMPPLALPAARVKAADYLELTKPRITSMVLVTTLVGFYLGLRVPLFQAGWSNVVLLLNTLIGTGLMSAGSCVLNMLIEQAPDALMRRTSERPIPSGRITTRQALVFGVTLSLIGVAYLYVAVNPLTSVLSIAALVSYIGMYTPLKPITPWCTWVGAISGAIPPMMGWSAVRNEIGMVAWVLFAIMFLWQIPHFLAIAWLYREDYARGGFPMLSVNDTDGRETVRQMTLYSAALWGVSLLPTVYQATGILYWCVALIMGVIFLVLNLQFTRKRTLPMARRVFLFSLIYLTVIFGVMLVDKVLP